MPDFVSADEARERLETERLTYILGRVSPEPWSANPMGIMLDADGNRLVKEADGNMTSADAELAAMAPDLASTVIAQAEQLEKVRQIRSTLNQLISVGDCISATPEELAKSIVNKLNDALGDTND